MQSLKTVLARLRLRIEMALVRASGRFDPAYYRVAYPDVAEAGADPLRHFCEHGWREVRNPGPWFDMAYQSTLRKQANCNPLLTWQILGRWLGRPATYPEVERLRSDIRATDPVAADAILLLHECTRTGAPIFLQSLARAWREHHGMRIHFVILGYGPTLAELCQEFECTLLPTLPPAERFGILAARFAAAQPLLYCNSASSLQALEWFDWHQGSTIVHIHEIGASLAAYAADLPRIKRLDATILTVDAGARSQLASLIGAAPENLHVVPPAVRIGPAPAARSELRQLVVGCGTASLRKGADLFCEVAARLRAEGHDTARFVWIGGPGDADMASVIRRLGLEDMVEVVGEVADPASLFDQASLLLLPSREDPYPLVCLEAAERGVPTVCFDRRAGGIAAFVEDDAGVVVPAFDVDAMANAVRGLLEDEERCRALGRAARAKVERQHAIESVAQTILDLAADRVRRGGDQGRISR